MTNDFFSSLEEKWMFFENIADELYDTMHMINKNSAALAHVDESTEDIEALRILVRRVWQHCHKRSDEAFLEYYASSEYERSTRIE